MNQLDEQTVREAEEERRRRAIDAAHSVWRTPAYRGHWIGAVLFCATMVAGAVLYSGWPLAASVMRGEAPDRGTATTFFVLYGAMVVLPLAGWGLWITGRRWAGLAVAALFFACVAWLGPVL